MNKRATDKEIEVKILGNSHYRNSPARSQVGMLTAARLVRGSLGNRRSARDTYTGEYLFWRAFLEGALLLYSLL